MMKNPLRTALVIGAVLIIAAAFGCGSSETDGAGSAPTATTAAPTATIATPTPQPTATPEPRQPVLRSLPSALQNPESAEELSRDAVLAVWEEFVTGTYFDTTGYGSIFHFCENGLMAPDNEETTSVFVTGVEGSWTIEPPSAGASHDWWEAAIFAESVELKGRHGILLALGVSGTDATGTFSGRPESLAMYESELCRERAS